MIPTDMAAVRALQTYLKENVEGIAEVYDEWPNHNEELNLPCISLITQGTPVYTNLMPYTYRQETDPDNAQNIKLTEVIGQFDSRIQLDIWTEYKIARGRIFELVHDAMNKELLEKDLPAGLSLTMADYHDVIARFDVVGYTYMDSEENSQRDEWRVKLDLLVNYPKVAIKSRPRIDDITLINQISEKVKVEESDSNIEENYTI